MKFGLLDCVYQTWIYDGIKGNSLIFFKNDLQNILKENLKSEIRQSNLLKDKTSKITYSDNNNGYVFFNFNFEL